MRNDMPPVLVTSAKLEPELRSFQHTGFVTRPLGALHPQCCPATALRNEPAREPAVYHLTALEFVSDPAGEGTRANCPPACPTAAKPAA